MGSRPGNVTASWSGAYLIFWGMFESDVHHGATESEHGVKQWLVAPRTLLSSATHVGNHSVFKGFLRVLRVSVVN